MEKLISILLATTSLFTTGGQAVGKTIENASVIVDRIEDNNYAVVEISYNDNIKMVDVKQEYFNTPKTEGEKIDYSIATGKIDGTLKTCDTGEILYHFKSDDNAVWWMLTEKEIGFVPNNEDLYTLIYYNNGTTIKNKPCDCLPEYECECEVYDDIFLALMENSQAKENRIKGYYDLAETNNLFKIYRSYELTNEILTNRKGEIIVEVVIGKCINSESGDGVELGKENDYYNYISYKNVGGVKTNDIVCSYMIYNPDNNYEDDIIERYDFIIDSDK